ncbi:MAG: hypothetical protein L3K19_02480 [Thermoplasmata archaeon]|nr:hypothetical protein [Thermoplasmata archaeon]
MRPNYRFVRIVATRWLAVELAAGLLCLCITIVGVSAIISLLLTRNLATLLPVTLGFGSTSAWLASQSWPIVHDAWHGFAPGR